MFRSGGTSIVISAIVHGSVLAGLAMIQQQLLEKQPEIAVETFFEEERTQEEFTQELEIESEISENLNVVAGGVVSTEVGGSGAPQVAQQNIEISETLKEPDVQVNVSPVSIAGLLEIGHDQGEGAVSGEVGAVVEGYGAAMSRITMEIIRLMRDQRVMVVWLFDESGSMKDDQQEIREKFHKVYEELGLAQEQDARAKRGPEPLWTSIIGFGKEFHELTPKPTADIRQIRSAIDRIAIDETGEENMCRSIIEVADKYGAMAQKAKRRLAIVVISDESPSDDDKMELAIQRAQRFKSPVYLLGREAIFGYPWTRVLWTDSIYGLNHWIRIDRGPETAYPEALQWDGMHSRWDSFSSGFGAYSQVRIAKETGGIFFILPGEEQNLSGVGAHERRQFDALDMKEYEPKLLSRREYEEQRKTSEFRTALWNIIVMLNPNLDAQLNLRIYHYPIDPAGFREVGGREFQKVTRSMSMLNQAIGILKKIEPLRAREDSQRWRANYDLILAQAYAYRVRLFQYMLAADDHMRNMPKPKDEKSNEWRVGRSGKMVIPNEEQFLRIKKAFGLKSSREEYLAELTSQSEQALALYEVVIREHPGTPWARRAEHERRMGFGVNFYEHFHDPRYSQVGKKIELPKL